MVPNVFGTEGLQNFNKEFFVVYSCYSCAYCYSCCYRYCQYFDVIDVHSVKYMTHSAAVATAKTTTLTIMSIRVEITAYALKNSIKFELQVFQIYFYILNRVYMWYIGLLIYVWAT